MKTKYLNNEIELLNSIKRNNELSDYGKEKLNEFNKIKEQLILSAVIHWVAIKEQKPPNKNKRYLTFKDGEMIFQNWHYTNGNGYWYDYLGVTHWTEIPKPPCL